MKIIAISDLHGYLPKLSLCDVVCIAGDILPLEYQNNTIKSVSWFLQDFVPWANYLPCNKVIFIAGNHDFLFDTLSKSNQLDWEIEELLLTSHLDSTNIKYLCDSEYIYNGVKFYGTPWIPDLHKWAFYAGNNKLKEKFKQIPYDVDVLITHAPPKVGNCGTVLAYNNRNNGKNFGCIELAEEYSRINPKYHVFGHVHSGDHNITSYNNSKLVNVSLKDENYNIFYEPFIFEI